MPMINSLQQQAQLLFEQRLMMQSERYVTLPQLRQHDYQLIDCLKLLQGTSNPGAPDWLNWLLCDDICPLDEHSVAQWPQPDAAWLLLHELKAVEHSDKVQQLMQQMLHQHCDKQCLVWRYAWRQQLPLGELTLNELTDSNALWYLGTRGQAEQLTSLHRFLQQLSPQHPLAVHARLAAYLLGDKTDEVKLVIMLNDIKALHEVALMLLLSGAADPTQSQIINYLATLDKADLAIAAMGYSGQLKFVPLLLELAQQHDNSAQAKAALSLLLGVVDADSLLGSQDIALLLQGKVGRKLAGAVISEQQLEHVARQGNLAQRQLAACYQFLAQPGAVLRNCCALSGASRE